LETRKRKKGPRASAVLPYRSSYLFAVGPLTRREERSGITSQIKAHDVLASNPNPKGNMQAVQVGNRLDGGPKESGAERGGGGKGDRPARSEGGLVKGDRWGHNIAGGV